MCIVSRSKRMNLVILSMYRNPPLTFEACRRLQPKWRPSLENIHSCSSRCIHPGQFLLIRYIWALRYLVASNHSSSTHFITRPASHHLHPSASSLCFILIQPPIHHASGQLKRPSSLHLGETKTLRYGFNPSSTDRRNHIYLPPYLFLLHLRRLAFQHLLYPPSLYSCSSRRLR